jgi:cation transport ATPase
VVLLLLLAAVSFLTGDDRAGVVMLIMVLLGVVLRFIQEARADTTAAKLKAMIRVTATVVRDGKACEVPLSDLVPGDVVHLSAGDDYRNGAGDGHVVWRLGQGGDFALNSTDPTAWFSHQHNMVH